MQSSVIAAVLFLVLVGFFCWCACAVAEEADRRDEEAKRERKKEIEDNITDITNKVAKEMGYEVTVKEPSSDTFESLFGVSVEDLKKMAEMEVGDEAK